MSHGRLAASREDGGTTTHAALAEITRMHADAFPKKSIEYLHEVAEADLLAQHVRFTLLHSGRYFDIDATGDQVELSEMIFHRMEGTLIAESWRMTFPDSVYQALTVRPETS